MLFPQLEFEQSVKADSDDEVFGEAAEEYNLDDVKNFYHRPTEGEHNQDLPAQKDEEYK